MQVISNLDGLSLRIRCIKVPPNYLISSARKNNEEIYLFSTFVTEYFYFSVFYCIFIFFGTDTVYLT